MYEAMMKDINVVAMCLDQLGLNHLTKKLLKVGFQSSTLDKYLSIIKNTAEKKNNIDVLERLNFSGLIYG